MGIFLIWAQIWWYYVWQSDLECLLNSVLLGLRFDKNAKNNNWATLRFTARAEILVSFDLMIDDFLLFFFFFWPTTRPFLMKTKKIAQLGPYSMKSAKNKYFRRFLSKNNRKLTKYCSDSYEVNMAPSGQLGPYLMKSKKRCKNKYFTWLLFKNNRKLTKYCSDSHKPNNGAARAK